MTLPDSMLRKTTRCLALLGAAAALSLMAFAARAQESAAVPGLTLEAADPTEKGDGTLSPAAKAALERGSLPFSAADVAAKAAANRAREEAEKSRAKRPIRPPDLPPASGARPLAPVIVGGFNKPGLADFSYSPPDTTGAIGPTRFIQLVNRLAGIFDRTTGRLMAYGTLNELAGIAANLKSTDPQVIWDPQTTRFYYTALFRFTATDWKLGIGFSKTSSPNNVITEWCHYTLTAGGQKLDFPKLGHSGYFFIIGVNVIDDPKSVFLGSRIFAISKPPAGTGCPAPSTFRVGGSPYLVGSFGQQVFSPVPANQIDTLATGFVVARDHLLPSDKLWFFNVTKLATGVPFFGHARGVTVAGYTSPVAAFQPGATQRLDTGDARMTQAVQAFDPFFGTYSFWTQQTIATADGFSAVRWYEINPVPETPDLLQFGTLQSPGIFFFNAAISPDRRVDGATRSFGKNFVIEFNYVSQSLATYPSVGAVSSINGGPLHFLLIREGVRPYIDFNSCANAGDRCKWGDYSAATPDPRPTTTDRGVVWGTNQFPDDTPRPNSADWVTQIFSLEP